MNQISLNFSPCDPAPQAGYIVNWRVKGSSDAYTNAGNFFASPAVFEDNANPTGTLYEGFISSDMGPLSDCAQIPWETESGGPPPTEYSIVAAPCSGINSTYTITGAIGDVITVRASFGGVMQKIGNLFVRADLQINSPDGTSDLSSSICYTDTGSHGFTITADTIITMVGPTAQVNLMAVVHNSLETYTNVAVVIIGVNGEAKFIPAVGCRGNSSTTGTC